MSGATLANNFISIFQICCMGLGMGASVLTSRFWGMKDIVSLKKAINIMYRLMLTIALGFCIATVLVPEGIMGIFTTEEAVILAGTGYLLVSICSFFINIFFNWLFIFGSLGALAGLVWHWPGFWIYIMLKIDQFIKAIWCIFRLKSGKWIKKIEGSSGS